MGLPGLIGRKVGMTRFFTEQGLSIPVTVIKIDKNYVTQIRRVVQNSCYFVQVTTGVKKINRILKSELGHFSKSRINVGQVLFEFSLKDIDGIFVSQGFSVEFFKGIKKVDVTGFSKGKGFSGTVKRWNFHMQDASHGNSLSHRVPGSIGQNQTPGKVFKGKKMSGHLGNERVTIQNLDVVCVDKIYDVLLIKGSVPGNIGANLLVKIAVKCLLH
ncbi:MAG: 50S ribosomal subunit protein L3 [Candidatus Westeberhardia cardiocondylae]|nr:50S ribosomal subunit protein L3 [Candidatus Westeberhardia cardiocondylae]